MVTEVLAVELATALPPKGRWFNGLMHAGSELIGRYFGFTDDVVKPRWANCSERSWRRHSAYLTVMREEKNLGQ